MESIKTFIFRGSDVALGLYDDNGVWNVLLGSQSDSDSYAMYSTSDYDTAIDIYDEIRNYISKHECYECAAEMFRIETARFYRDVEYEVIIERGKRVEC